MKSHTKVSFNVKRTFTAFVSRATGAVEPERPAFTSSAAFVYRTDMVLSFGNGNLWQFYSILISFFV